jgi:hypothetical protein
MENSEFMRESVTAAKSCCLFLLVAIAVLMVPCLAAAIDVVHSDVVRVTVDESQSQICLSAGYFVNVHSDFYPAFRSGFASSVAFLHDFRSGYGYEIRSGVRLMLEGKSNVNYISLSPAFLVTRRILTTDRFRVRVGVGPGLGIRDYADTYVSGAYYEDRFHQREYSLMAVAETGIDCNVGGFVIKTSVVFERHLTGDPSRGDFGDTGGFTFLLGFGVRM